MPGQSCLDRTARIRQPEKIIRMGRQNGKVNGDRQIGIRRIGQAEQDCQEDSQGRNVGTVRKGEPEKEC